MDEKNINGNINIRALEILENEQQNKQNPFTRIEMRGHKGNMSRSYIV